MLSDGNQTSGEDYVFGFNPANKVYPLVVGDTMTYLDLKITQLNVNKYAFHKNKFPVEVFLHYAGTKAINASFKITQGNTLLTEQTVSFSPDKKAATMNVLLPADRVGLQILKATISSKEQEKNTYNNTKNFAVEVIDQKTEVALIADFAHPDLGAIKRSIETNVQRKVTILKPNEIKSLTDYNILIFYQPTVAFKSRFEQFPPLENPFGTITTKGNTNTLLSSMIRNIATNQPLLTFTENQGVRGAYLFGENIWKWRAENYVNKKNFTDFDIFLDKTIQYLASNNSRKSLVVKHERFYNSGEGIEITAQYFNKNYELDEKARLTIAVTNTKTKQVKNYDLLRTTNAFQANLDGLAAGNYKFTVKELNSNSFYSSSFEVLDFDIEKQFVNPDWNKLNQLATQTQGKAFLPSQVDALVKQLLEDESYKAIQKTIVKKSPLIDWIWLLVLLALFLASEWFIRKYNGLL